MPGGYTCVPASQGTKIGGSFEPRLFSTMPHLKRFKMFFKYLFYYYFMGLDVFLPVCLYTVHVPGAQ